MLSVVALVVFLALATFLKVGVRRLFRGGQEHPAARGARAPTARTPRAVGTRPTSARQLRADRPSGPAGHPQGGGGRRRAPGRGPDHIKS